MSTPIAKELMDAAYLVLAQYAVKSRKPLDEVAADIAATFAPLCSPVPRSGEWFDSFSWLEEVLRQSTHLNAAGRDALANRIMERLHAPVPPQCSQGEDRIGGFRITPEGLKMNEPLPPTANETKAYLQHERTDLVAQLTSQGEEIARLTRQRDTAYDVGKKLAANAAETGRELRDQIARLTKERDEARNAHRLQQANYVRLYEAVRGGGTVTSDFADPVEIVADLRSRITALESGLTVAKGALELISKTADADRGNAIELKEIADAALLAKPTVASAGTAGDEGEGK